MAKKNSKGTVYIGPVSNIAKGIIHKTHPRGWYTNKYASMEDTAKLRRELKKKAEDVASGRVVTKFQKLLEKAKVATIEGSKRYGHFGKRGFVFKKEVSEKARSLLESGEHAAWMARVSLHGKRLAVAKKLKEEGYDVKVLYTDNGKHEYGFFVDDAKKLGLECVKINWVDNGIVQ